MKEKRNREIVTIAFGPYRAGRAEWNPDFTEKLALRRLHRSKDQVYTMASYLSILRLIIYTGIACSCLYQLPAICGLCPAIPALNIVVPAAK